MVKRQAARVLTHPAVGRAASRAFSGRIPSAGVRIDTRSPVVADSSRAQLLWQIYEGAEHRLSRACLRPAETLVELGTSLGFVSSVAVKATGARRFIGVEANPNLIPLATSNVKANAPWVSVSVLHGAISYEVEPETLISFAAGPQHTGARAAGPESAASFSAPALRLSRVLQDQVVEDYTLVCDIEGAEAGIFLEDSESLHGCQQALVELHDTNFRGHQLRIADLKDAAIAAGFTVQASYGPVVVLARNPKR